MMNKIVEVKESANGGTKAESMDKAGNEKLFNKQALFDCCRKKYLKLL